MTRQQQYLVHALTNVSSVADKNDRELGDAYGGLCHKIPMLVRNDGLAQAVAWIEEKAANTSPDDNEAKSLARAYALQREHITDLLGASGNGQAGSPLVRAVHGASNTDYMRYTMMLLDAWVYYKRFASSVLGVDAGDRDDEQEEAAE